MKASEDGRTHASDCGAAVEEKTSIMPQCRFASKIIAVTLCAVQTAKSSSGYISGRRDRRV